MSVKYTHPPENIIWHQKCIHIGRIATPVGIGYSYAYFPYGVHLISEAPVSDFSVSAAGCSGYTAARKGNRSIDHPFYRLLKKLHIIIDEKHMIGYDPVIQNIFHALSHAACPKEFSVTVQYIHLPAFFSIF
jgi:hypothetical protein